jgi:hypothetical protein
VNLFAPRRGAPLKATRELIATVIAELRTAPVSDQFAILGPDDLTYVQTLLTTDGFVLQYQEGDTEHHYESVRGDLNGLRWWRPLARTSTAMLHGGGHLSGGRWKSGPGHTDWVKASGGCLAGSLDGLAVDTGDPAGCSLTR